MVESEIPRRGLPFPDDESSLDHVPFPQSEEDFKEDPRVAYSQMDKKWILENDDGSEWEYDERQKRWIPALDEELVEMQRQAYVVPGVNEEEPDHAQKKRKIGTDAIDGDHAGNKKARSKKESKDGQKPKDRTAANTAVYVTSIPLDATKDEVVALFSKFGVIAEGIDSGEKRVKLYMDEAGKFKGDALVVYFRRESVPLAIQMLDDTDFRLGENGPDGKMRVAEAESSYKKNREVPDNTSRREKQKIIKKSQKLNNKLADWDDDDPSVLEDKSSKFDKIVVVKHMFTLEDLKDDPAAELEIKEDVREECGKVGTVTNVILYDKEDAGVLTVRFSDPRSAVQAVKLMDGRFFAGRRVEAYIHDGSERFKKSGGKQAGANSDDEADEQKRLDNFGEWLETQE